MKKIFTFLVGSFITVASFAADHRPTMNIDNNSYYKVLIDGRPVYNDFNGGNIGDINYGRHTITVLEDRGGGFFSRRSRIVSTSDFRVDGDDRRIFVNIDRAGCIHVGKTEFRDDRDFGWGRDRDHRNWDNDNGYRNGTNGGY
ncbi:MAG TPA: hypothetical protein VGG71_00625 [Chitinophagaceae bacterium]